MTALTKSMEISFGSALEMFMNYRVVLGDESSCDDKHVLFYVDAARPRHFRRRFEGYTSSVRVPVDLCHYLLHTRQFVMAGSERGDMSDVLAVLHFRPPPQTRPSVYLDRNDFEHLFSGRSSHTVADERGRRPYIDYDDDTAIGTVFVLTLCTTPKSSRDAYIMMRLERSGVVAFEGRGWLRVH